MAISGLPDAADIQKWINIILTLPGYVLDQVFITARIPDTTASATLRLSCLLIFSVGSLIICYRYRRNFLAWFFGLYALLLTIVSTFQMVSTLWILLFPPVVEVNGDINVFKRDLSNSNGKVLGSWISNDCGASNVLEVPRCNLDGRPLSPPYNVHINSANCGSAVENVRADPSNPSCLIVRERQQGCGYDSILGIKNCKGRGWLDYIVTGTIQNTTTALILNKKIHTTFKSGQDIEISIPEIKDKLNGDLFATYRLTLQIPGEKPTILSETSPSAGSFVSNFSDGKIVIRQSSTASPPSKL